MAHSKFVLAGVALAAFAPLAHAGRLALDDAAAMLKKSMDMYKSLKSCSCTYSWSNAMSNGTMNSTRTLIYVAPNKFKATTHITEQSMQLTSISDGAGVLEYSTMGGQPALSFPAPASLDAADSMFMTVNIFSGTLLYRFFGGSAGYGKLVDDSKGPATLAGEQKEPDEMARHIKFYGPDLYGHVDVLIGERTLRVYVISYDSEPLIKEMSQQKGSGDEKITSALATETYFEMKLNPALGDSQFSTTPPAGMKVRKSTDPGPR